MPLNVLVTRPKKQAGNLCDLIENIGAIPIEFPVLEIIPIEPDKEIFAKLKALHHYQWVFFISTNAVNFALHAINGKIGCFDKVSVVAIGKKTASVLSESGLKVDLVPEQNFNSEAVLSMPQLQNLAGQACLIIRGRGGRELLKQTLEQRGAKVEYLEVYQRIIPEINKEPVKKLISNNELDVITITSGQALYNLVTTIDNSLQQQLFSTVLVVISERIKQLATNIGFNRVIVAEQASDAALVKAIVNGEKCGRSE